MFMSYIPRTRSSLFPISLWRQLMTLNAMQMHHLINMKNSVSDLISRSTETFSNCFSSETSWSQMCTVSWPCIILPFSPSQFSKAAFLTLSEPGFTAQYVIWWISVPIANPQACPETLILPMEGTIRHIFWSRRVYCDRQLWLSSQLTLRFLILWKPQRSGVTNLKLVFSILTLLFHLNSFKTRAVGLYTCGPGETQPVSGSLCRGLKQNQRYLHTRKPWLVMGQGTACHTLPLTIGYSAMVVATYVMFILPTWNTL